MLGEFKKRSPATRCQPVQVPTAKLEDLVLVPRDPKERTPIHPLTSNCDSCAFLTAFCLPPQKSLRDPLLVLFLVQQIPDKSGFREIGFILVRGLGGQSIVARRSSGGNERWLALCGQPGREQR